MRVRLDQPRHTWVTTQIEAGTEDPALAYRAGHGDSGFTKRQYGHVRERVRRQAADTYDATARTGHGSAGSGR